MRGIGAMHGLVVRAREGKERGRRDTEREAGRWREDESGEGKSRGGSEGE